LLCNHLPKPFPTARRDCSIQLSYAAIFPFQVAVFLNWSAKIENYFIPPKPFCIFAANRAMKFVIRAVGKPHESFVKEGVELFTKRLNNYFAADWQIVPMPKNAAALPPAELKRKEGELIIQGIAREDVVVLLDERGKLWSSDALAQFIQQRANESTRQLIFVIGGAFGISDEVAKRANFTWSLSALVFPHQLVRLILAEQLYRACTILKNEKYHHP
jgi:23S rRNA (pseudouridine1915-N3)-methyltransferase